MVAHPRPNAEADYRARSSPPQRGCRRVREQPHMLPLSGSHLLIVPCVQIQRQSSALTFAYGIPHLCRVPHAGRLHPTNKDARIIRIEDSPSVRRCPFCRSSDWLSNVKEFAHGPIQLRLPLPLALEVNPVSLSKDYRLGPTLLRHGPSGVHVNLTQTSASGS
jgi:hypothetical protein